MYWAVASLLCAQSFDAIPLETIENVAAREELLDEMEDDEQNTDEDSDSDEEENSSSGIVSVDQHNCRMPQLLIIMQLYTLWQLALNACVS